MLEPKPHGVIADVPLAQRVMTVALHVKALNWWRRSAVLPAFALISPLYGMAGHVGAGPTGLPVRASWRRRRIWTRCPRGERPTRGRLVALSAALGALDGRMREAHLAAHTGIREALSPDQRAAYARLRG